MRTVRLMFSQLHRLEGALGLMPRPPDLVLADVRLHAQAKRGADELAELTDAPTWSTVEELVERVLEFVETGRLGWELPVSAGAFVAGSTDIESVSLAELAGATELRPLHGIVIELVGEDDSPIPGLEYEVVLPDGSIRVGSLDAEGCAELMDLADAGDCRVCFPSLDRGAWEYIASTPL